MICHLNLCNEDHTVPQFIELESSDIITRSPEYQAFKKIQEGSYHVLSIVENLSTKVILLESSTYSIGRHSANSIILDSPKISRHHASLIRLIDSKTNKYYFRIIDGDLQGKSSLNGISINRKRLKSHDLQDQDVICFDENIKITYFNVLNFLDPKYPKYPQICELPIPVLDRKLSHDFIVSKNTRNDINENEGNAELERIEKNSDSELYRVYSFSELNPYPIVETDLNGFITYINPIAAVQFQKIQLASKHELFDGLFNLLQKGSQLLTTREVEFNGCTYEQSIHCILQSKLIRSYFVDITQRKRLGQKLYESEQRFAMAARGSNDGMWEWNLLSNTIYLSPRWKIMLGYEEHEIGSNPDDWLTLIHPLDRDKFYQDLSAHLEGNTSHFECEYRIYLKDGSTKWVLTRGLAVWDENNKPQQIAGSQTDITRYHQISEQLTYDALHDPMTGLPNRTLFMDRLGQAIRNLRRRKDYLCAVLFLDLDRFKIINDSLGHLSGDQLLIEVTHRLCGCLRAEDTVARIGGDEFVILLDNINNKDVSIITAEKVLDSFKKSFSINGQEIFSSTSIGIALGSSEYVSSEELLRDADTAMYKAKRLGKNRYEIFDSDLRLQAVQQLSLETDLKHAIEKNEFNLVYQPIVALKDKQLVGFEALVRWNHPEHGIIKPEAFIPLAEETGLIVQFGWWILREACLQMHNWILKYPYLLELTMSVNISSNQLNQHDFVDRTVLIIEEIGLSCSSLNLEITEGSVMHDPESVANKLHSIKSIGIDLMMDDFGTGYSSLSYLRKFPIDTLKIDRSFVNQMNDESGLEVVKTIINLAHNLKMQVVAEGVENEGQSKCLLELGCEYAQGYFFSKPLDRDKAEEFIIKNQSNSKSVDIENQPWEVIYQ